MLIDGWEYTMAEMTAQEFAAKFYKDRDFVVEVIDSIPIECLRGLEQVDEMSLEKLVAIIKPAAEVLGCDAAEEELLKELKEQADHAGINLIKTLFVAGLALAKRAKEL